MRKWLVGVMFLVSVTVFGSQNEYRIAILDFEVMTTQEAYRFIGKGLAEILSFELSNEKAFTIIERSKRNAVLEEINFSLSGLSDDEASLDVGRLLTANFLVVGEVIEMDRHFLVTMKLLNVETGAVEWQEQVLSRLNNYEALSRSFAKSLTSAIVTEGASTNDSELEEVPVPEDSNDNRAESLIAFSTAVDAIDDGKTEKARQELSRARVIDPESKVVKHYLSLLTVVSPKFNFELRPWGSVYNPAYLPTYSKDKFYFWQSIPLDISSTNSYSVSSEIEAKENSQSTRFGYLFHVGKQHGIEVAFLWSTTFQHISTTVDYDFFGTTDDQINYDSNNIGLNIGYGFSITPSFSLGLTFQPFIHYWPDESDLLPTTFQYSFSAGTLLSVLNDRLLWDFQATYTSQPQYYAVEIEQKYYWGSAPLFLETSFIGAAIPNSLFFSLKSNFDIYIDDRGGFYFRIIPMAEYWIKGIVGIRAGYLMSYLNQFDQNVFGNGVTAGITASLGKWEIDLAFSYSMTPITTVPGYLIPEPRVLIGVSRNGNFIGK